MGADGMRPAEGMMVDSKYVQDADDYYRQAMNEHQQIRGLEIVTNDKEAAAYSQTLMALQQLPGTARYVK
ncbi:restriction endonuclease fold toxin-2 domain-containing protein [Streptomyces sp. NPDC048018]|uniref:restriction endonuclease fold toxin-2 domain-containing protein n=1 Tax=Streptomyces sp. NPDC048018 TaxID=3365499 RepID=UPI00372188E4